MLYKANFTKKEKKLSCDLEKEPGDQAVNSV